MSKVENIERRIQTYQQELRKLRLQLKIAKIEQSTIQALSQQQNRQKQEKTRA